MPDRFTYRYRSPRRPLDLGYLPPDVADTFDLDAWFAQDEDTRSTRHPNLPAVYTFALPIPEAFIRQWGLEVVEVPS